MSSLKQVVVQPWPAMWTIVTEMWKNILVYLMNTLFCTKHLNEEQMFHNTAEDGG